MGRSTDRGRPGLDYWSPDPDGYHAYAQTPTSISPSAPASARATKLPTTSRSLADRFRTDRLKRALLPAVAFVVVVGSSFGAAPVRVTAAGQQSGSAATTRVMAQAQTSQSQSSSSQTDAAASTTDTPIDTSLQQRQSVMSYTVQPGDTIRSIAARFGLQTNTIFWANRNTVSNPDQILPGQSLVILPTDGVYVTVQPGQSIYGLAEIWGVAPTAITGYAPNGISMDSTILPGDNLIIPGVDLSWPPPQPASTVTVDSTSHSSSQQAESSTSSSSTGASSSTSTASTGTTTTQQSAELAQQSTPTPLQEQPEPKQATTPTEQQSEQTTPTPTPLPPSPTATAPPPPTPTPTPVPPTPTPVPSTPTPEQVPQTAAPLSGTVGDIPADQLPVIKSSASICGMPWSVLAAVAKIESGFGANMSTNPSAAMGYGQFLPSSWAAYGDGGDPYDFHDALPAMARYLCANGAPGNMSGALYAYNRSSSYVNQVLSIAAEYEQEAGGQ